MHILYVHRNYPAQFGHIARYLAKHRGYQCTFVSEKAGKDHPKLRRLQYVPRGSATAATSYYGRTFENFVWHSHAVYECLKRATNVRPDVVVGHSGFGSTVFLRDLYDCP